MKYGNFEQHMETTYFPTLKGTEYCYLISFSSFSSFRLYLVPGKCERKKIGRKEKVKEMNIIFFTCLVIHGKFKGKQKKNSFSFIWLTTKKKSQGKIEGK